MAEGATTLGLLRDVDEWRTRVRISHGRTVKDGWRHETTVEVEWGGAGEIPDAEAAARLAELTRLADGIARRETERRRAIDAAAAERRDG